MRKVLEQRFFEKTVREEGPFDIYKKPLIAHSAVYSTIHNFQVLRIYDLISLLEVHKTVEAVEKLGRLHQKHARCP